MILHILFLSSQLNLFHNNCLSKIILKKSPLFVFRLIPYFLTSTAAAPVLSTLAPWNSENLYSKFTRWWADLCTSRKSWHWYLGFTYLSLHFSRVPWFLSCLSQDLWENIEARRAFGKYTWRERCRKGRSQLSWATDAQLSCSLLVTFVLHRRFCAHIPAHLLLPDSQVAFVLCTIYWLDFM